MSRVSAQQKETASSAVTGPASSSSHAEELAKQLSNPVASLISVPFQFNFDGNMGPEDEGERYS